METGIIQIYIVPKIVQESKQLGSLILSFKFKPLFYYLSDLGV